MKSRLNAHTRQCGDNQGELFAVQESKPRISATKHNESGWKKGELEVIKWPFLCPLERISYSISLDRSSKTVNAYPITTTRRPST